jgi:hypothetical protein
MQMETFRIRRHASLLRQQQAPCRRRRLPSSKADLLAQLIEAAGGNVQPGAIDTAPIEQLLEQGCDLDLDVLPAVRHLLTDPIQPPLRRWSVLWLGEEIIRRRDAGMGSDRQPPPEPLQRGRRPLPTRAPACRLT